MQRLRHREGKGLSEGGTRGFEEKASRSPSVLTTRANPFFLLPVKPSQVLMAMPFLCGAASCPCFPPADFVWCSFLPTSQPLWEPATLQGPPDPSIRDWSPPHLCSSVTLCGLPSRPRETRQDVVMHRAPFPPDAAS